jgi:hypothetical protein
MTEKLPQTDSASPDPQPNCACTPAEPSSPPVTSARHVFWRIAFSRWVDVECLRKHPRSFGASPYQLFCVRYLVRSLLEHQHIALRNKLILFSQIEAVVIELADN